MKTVITNNFDFQAEEQKALGMKPVELIGAIHDALDTIQNFENCGMKQEACKYYDQISVYRKVLNEKRKYLARSRREGQRGNPKFKIRG